MEGGADKRGSISKELPAAASVEDSFTCSREGQSRGKL